MIGVSVSSSDFSALYIKQSAKTVISLVGGTENSLTDGSVYSAEKLEDGKPTAALYSKDDLTINGSGTLTVNGNYEDGIKANDIFRMTGGTLRVTAADDGINVNDYIATAGAVIEVVSGGDAVIGPESINISSCCEGIEGAYITINGGSISIIASDDAIKATC